MNTKQLTEIFSAVVHRWIKSSDDADLTKQYRSLPHVPGELLNLAAGARTRLMEPPGTKKRRLVETEIDVLLEVFEAELDAYFE